jgi:hypothetical protein
MQRLAMNLASFAVLGILPSGGGQSLRAADEDVTSPDYESITTEDDEGNTRMTPGKVDREVIDEVLFWGSNERFGWRVGTLLVNDLVSDEPVKPGETIAVQFFLQNVSDEPQTVRVQKIDDTYPVLGEGGRISLNTLHGSGSVEFTAQPGEAVSPDGFAILLESTGLPDGEYTIGTTAAFSIPNESGNGGSSPWRVGRVSMTIGEGGGFETDPTTDEDGVVWGGVVAGLHVGMRLAEGRRQWPVGSLLEGELYVKNVSDEPITFTWDKPAPLDQNQVVRTAEGEYVRLHSVFFTGIRARNPQTFTVKAGEQVRLGTAQLKSQAKPSDPSYDDPAQLVATTGEFTWTVHVELPRESIPEMTIIAGSGPVPFEIVGEDDADAMR